MKTGWAGMRLGIVAYVVPFLFAYHPALLMQGSVLDIGLAVATAVLGVVLLAVACVGYLFRPMGWPARLGFGAAGLLLLPPPSSAWWLLANVVGLVLGLAVVLLERTGARLQASEHAA